MSAPVIALRDLDEPGSSEPAVAARPAGPPPLPENYRALGSSAVRLVPPSVDGPLAEQNGGSAQPASAAEVAFEPRPPSLLANAPSWLVSLVFHMVLMLMLALISPVHRAESTSTALLVSTAEPSALETLETLATETDQPTQLAVTAEAVHGAAKIEPAAVRVERNMVESQAPPIALDPVGGNAAANDLLARVGSVAGDALSGRGKVARSQMLSRYGGTPASEAAVNMALKWLAKHRMGDGGWTFQLTAVPECAGKCGGSGRMVAGRIAATGLALLPFLGAGQTHREGEYRGVVKEGLYYLVRQMKTTPLGGALNEPGGRMYSHGIAAIVLCEAYAMTGDKALHAPAQQAVNFICGAQDPVGGGWRYEPFQPGDTSVVGWQIMALKSALFAQLSVPALVFRRTSAFLDSVQSENGALYGYTFPLDVPAAAPGDGAATTAIGLLCRMHLGWSKDTPGLRRGIQLLSESGPIPGNMYFNYYATQVLRHWEGPEWKRWNERMRDQLVASQYLKGHERGSWYMTERDVGALVGGRLYCTAMAAMILEVYYRHMPIYSKKTLEASFPD